MLADPCESAGDHPRWTPTVHFYLLLIREQILFFILYIFFFSTLVVKKGQLLLRDVIARKIGQKAHGKNVRIVATGVLKTRKYL